MNEITKSTSDARMTLALQDGPPGVLNYMNELHQEAVAEATRDGLKIVGDPLWMREYGGLKITIFTEER